MYKKNLYFRRYIQDIFIDFVYKTIHRLYLLEVFKRPFVALSLQIFKNVFYECNPFPVLWSSSSPGEKNINVNSTPVPRNGFELKILKLYTRTLIDKSSYIFPMWNPFGYFHFESSKKPKLLLIFILCRLANGFIISAFVQKRPDGHYFPYDSFETF